MKVLYLEDVVKYFKRLQPYFEDNWIVWDLGVEYDGVRLEKRVGKKKFKTIRLTRDEKALLKSVSHFLIFREFKAIESIMKDSRKLGILVEEESK